MPFNKTKMNLLKVSLFLFVGLTIVFAGFLFLRQGIFAQEPGEVIDQTGANHGTARNGADTTPDGKFKRGGKFDGIDDYVEIGNVYTATGIKTIELWAKPNAVDVTEELIDLNGTVYIKITNGTVSVPGFASPTIYINGSVGSAITTDWNHIVVTTNTGIDANDLDIARLENSSNFHGLIDEVRIYDRVLSSDEVLIIYNNYMEKMGSYYNVRKYVSPEPIFSGVGIEEGAPPAFCQSHNVKGWALPENIGWISFSCENETAIGEGVDYGVDIDETTGKFSGYAWSENIGWISFADFDGDGDIDADDENIAGSPCAPNCEAVLDLENGEVLGWARVLLTGEWIKLRGTAQDGTDYGLYVSENEFHNWAYGNELTGWISFNCAEGGYNEGSEEHYSVCEDSDYKVITDITINAPPFIENLGFDGDSDYCSIQAQGQIGIKWTFRDLDGDSQSEYHLQIATDSGFNNLVVDSIETQVIPESGTGTTNVVVKISPVLARDIGYAETYYWRMKVKDNEKWSKWEQYPDPFSTPSHPYPYVRFVWTPESPSADETVQLCSTYEDGVCGTDESVCYNNSFETCSCSGNLFEWTIPDAVFINPTDTSENPETQFSAPGDHSVKIRITDDVGSCYKEKIINSKLPLPGWKEITPFE